MKHNGARCWPPTAICDFLRWRDYTLERARKVLWLTLAHTRQERQNCSVEGFDPSVIPYPKSRRKSPSLCLDDHNSTNVPNVSVNFGPNAYRVFFCLHSTCSLDYSKTYNSAAENSYNWHLQEVEVELAFWAHPSRPRRPNGPRSSQWRPACKTSLRTKNLTMAFKLSTCTSSFTTYLRFRGLSNALLTQVHFMRPRRPHGDLSDTRRYNFAQYYPQRAGPIHDKSTKGSSCTLPPLTPTLRLAAATRYLVLPQISRSYFREGFVFDLQRVPYSAAS